MSSTNLASSLTPEPPLDDEKANIATANPRIRCILAPFMLPASLRVS
jgi:hypothetical protein